MYIDTRGVWPVLVSGLRAIELIGAPNDLKLINGRLSFGHFQIDCSFCYWFTPAIEKLLTPQ